MLCTACKSTLEQACNPLDFTFRCTTRFSDARQSAEEGCYICVTVYDSGKKSEIHESTLCNWKISKNDYPQFRGRADPAHFTRVGTLHITLLTRSDSVEGSYDIPLEYSLLKFEGKYASSILDLHVLKLRRGTEYSSSRHVPSTYSGSEASFTLMKGWIQECVQHHPMCNLYDITGWIPTRLIEIISSSSVRLIETQGGASIPQPVRFITLSHRWGKHQPKILEKSNEAAFKTGFQIAELPQTFVDAIHVTRELGLRYIWIDCLCILQDSEEDWRFESAQMMNVYKFAFLNLGATHGMSSNAGLFNRRETIRLSHPRLTAQGPGGDAQILYLDNCVFSQQLSVPKGPLLDRGWVLQERLLARRMIYFCSDQIYWQCGKRISNECHASIHGSGLFMKVPMISHTMYKVLNSHHLADKSLHEISKAWRALCINYSKLGLTYDSDRLIAISGLAAQFARSSNFPPDEYLSGIWKIGIPGDLLWYVKEGRKRRNHRIRGIPSWSWASLYCEPSYFNEKNAMFDTDLLVFRSSLLQSQVVLKDETQPFGQALYTSITIETLLIRIHGESHSFPKASGVHETVSILMTEDDSPLVQFPAKSVQRTLVCKLWDCNKDVSREDSLAAIILVEENPGPTTKFYGLLLSCEEAEGETYKREGMLNMAFHREYAEKILQHKEKLRKCITLV